MKKGINGNVDPSSFKDLFCITKMLLLLLLLLYCLSGGAVYSDSISGRPASYQSCAR